jgi:hypothetical protein
MAVTKQQVVLEVSADTKQVTKSIDNVTSSVDNTAQATSGLTNQLDKMTGGAVTGFRNMTSGIKSAVGGLKTFKVALAATGIGLLVVAVGSLITAFKSSEEGANKLSKIMTVLGSVVDNVLDVVADLGEAIIYAFENPREALTSFTDLIKDNLINRFEGLIEFFPKIGEAITLLFEGKFGQAGKVAADAVGKVTLGVESVTDATAAAAEATGDFFEQVVEEGEKAAQIADQRAKANKLERELLVDRAKLESEIAALRLKSRQEDEFTAQERKDALLEAQALEDQLLAKETEVLTLRRDAQVEENKLARSSVENLNKEAEAIAAVERQNAQRLNQQRTTQRELNRLNKELEREEAAAAKEREDAIKAQTEAEQKAAEERAKLRAAELEAQAKLEDELYAASLTAREREELALMQQYEQRIAIAGDNEGLILAATESFLSQQKALDDKYRAEKKAADDKAAQEDRQRQQALFNSRVQLTLGALNALAALNDAFSKKDDENAEKAFKRNKAIALATATVNTGQAVVNALTAGGNPIKLATGAQFVEAAIAAAAGAAQIVNISRTQYEAPAPPDTSIETPPTPTLSASEGAGISGAPQLDLSFLGQGATQAQPIQAYVLAESITNAQQANQLIAEQASL